jgi:hypothetical protein
VNRESHGFKPWEDVNDREPAEVTNLDRYGNPELPWSRARDALAAAASGPDIIYFLGTSRSDGRPHAAGVGAMWDEGELYLTSGAKARKARNLAANPACTISVKLEGIDLVLEGEAIRVTDKGPLERLAGRYRAVGWPAEVDGAALTAPFSAPSAGPPPWQLYRFVLQIGFGVATEEPYGATRWRFR